MQFSVAVICLKLILTHSLVLNLIGSNLDIKEPKGKKTTMKDVHNTHVCRLSQNKRDKTELNQVNQLLNAYYALSVCVYYI